MGLTDERDFEALFDACGAAVLAYLTRRTDRASAEDALSETFLVAWRRRAELPAEPLPWLYGVARRVLANQARGDRRRLALAFRLAHEAPAAVWSEGEQSDADAAVPTRARDDLPLSDPTLAALAALSEGDREVLLLDAWEELSRDEAAAVLGCRPNTYAVRLHRAKRRFAAAFEAPVPAQPRPSTTESRA